MPNDDPDHVFPGFSSPNYTPVPDELFDDLLAVLSGSELKVLLYIVRRTFGFKRASDTISLSQMLHGIATSDGRILDRGAGIKDKKTLLDAINKLERKGIILTQRQQSTARGNEPTLYRLHVRAEAQPGEFPPPLGGKSRPSFLGETNLNDVRRGQTLGRCSRQNTAGAYGRVNVAPYAGASYGRSMYSTKRIWPAARFSRPVFCSRAWHAARLGLDRRSRAAVFSP